MRPLVFSLILLLSACGAAQQDAATAAVSESEFTGAARQFAAKLVAGDFEQAHAMLGESLAHDMSASELRDNYRAMIEYGTGPVTLDGFLESMTDWPDKQANDVGWVYVSISGEDFAEAVTVIVSMESDQLRISSVEWGRP